MWCVCVCLCVFCSMGIVGHRTMDNQKFFEAKRPMVVVYFDVDYVRNLKGGWMGGCGCAHTHALPPVYRHVGTNYYRNRVIKVAKEFVGKLTFAISSWSEFGHEINEFGFEKGDNPVVGIRDSKGMKYKMTAEYR